MLNETQIVIAYGVAITIINLLILYLTYCHARNAKLWSDRALKRVQDVMIQAEKADDLLRQTRIELSRLRDTVAKSKEGIH